MKRKRQSTYVTVHSILIFLPGMSACKRSPKDKIEKTSLGCTWKNGLGSMWLVLSFLHFLPLQDPPTFGNCLVHYSQCLCLSYPSPLSSLFALANWCFFGNVFTKNARFCFFFTILMWQVRAIVGFHGCIAIQKVLNIRFSSMLDIRFPNQIIRGADIQLKFGFLHIHTPYFLHVSIEAKYQWLKGTMNQ